MSTQATREIRSGTDVLDVSPVIPVVVVEDAATAVPLAAALLRGGIGVIEITLRSAGGGRGHPRRGGRGPRDARRGRHRPHPRPGRRLPSSRPGRGSSSPPAPRRGCSTPSSRPACPALCRVGHPHRDAGPGRARASTAMKFFPAEASGGIPYLVVGRSAPARTLRFCPTGGISPANAAGVPRPAQRRLRRRLLAHTEGRRRRPATGTASRRSPPRPPRCARRPDPRRTLAVLLPARPSPLPLLPSPARESPPGAAVG